MPFIGPSGGGPFQPAGGAAASAAGSFTSFSFSSSDPSTEPAARLSISRRFAPPPAAPPAAAGLPFAASSFPFSSATAPAAATVGISGLRVGSTPAGIPGGVRDSPDARLHSVEASTTLTSPSMGSGPGVDEERPTAAGLLRPNGVH